MCLICSMVCGRLLQRPWGLTGLKRVFGISIKLLLILYIMMSLDFFLLSAKFSHPNVLIMSLGLADLRY